MSSNQQLQPQFQQLILGPGTRLTSSWFAYLANVLQQMQNQINDAVTFYDLYDLPASIIPAIDGIYDLGDPQNAWDSVYAYYGYFNDNVYVNGKVVLKDGDPVNIYEFFPIAQEQIVQAIEEATPSFQFDQYYNLKVNVQSPLDQYGNINTDLQFISPTAQQQITEAVKPAIPKLNLDQYGNVGVIIVDPVDTYGRVRVSVDQAFEPVSASGSVQAAYNTNGLSVVLQTNGRPYVSIYYNVSGSATLNVLVSPDGINWYPYSSTSISSASSGMVNLSGVSWKYVQVQVPTTGINIQIAVSASR